MDFDIFKKQLRKAYNQCLSSFTLEECFDIFTEYFKAYKVYTGNEHAPLKTEMLVDLISRLDGDGLFRPSDYSLMIKCYFNTFFRSCDRNICHFLSGKIRELRFYEVCL